MITQTKDEIAHSTRAAVVELIAACKERDEAEGQYGSAESLYGENSNADEMCAARLRAQKARKRYVTALARIGETK